MIDMGTLLGGGVAVALIECAEKLIVYIGNKRGKKKTETDLKIEALGKKIESLEVGQRAILRDRLRYLCRAYIAEDKISYVDRGDLITMHEAYHGEGGNGNLDAEMKEVMKLKCV